jgi:hypothetical protein
MAGVSFPVKRPPGRALIVGTPSGRAQPLATLQALGYDCAEVDDPYAAIAELVRRPLVYRAVVLSLTGLHKDELPIVSTVKRRLPHVDVWLTHIDGRQAALAEAMRLGADGLLAEDGLHRMAAPAGESTAAMAPAPAPSPPAPAPPAQPASLEIEIAGSAPSGSLAHEMDEEMSVGEPVLTAEELRALLQEQPMMPPDPDV